MLRNIPEEGRPQLYRGGSQRCCKRESLFVGTFPYDNTELATKAKLSCQEQNTRKPKIKSIIEQKTVCSNLVLYFVTP
jgi:hypothetical protein